MQRQPIVTAIKDQANKEGGEYDIPVLYYSVFNAGKGIPTHYVHDILMNRPGIRTNNPRQAKKQSDLRTQDLVLIKVKAWELGNTPCIPSIALNNAFKAVLQSATYAGWNFYNDIIQTPVADRTAKLSTIVPLVFKAEVPRLASALE